MESRSDACRTRAAVRWAARLSVNSAGVAYWCACLASTQEVRARSSPPAPSSVRLVARMPLFQSGGPGSKPGRRTIPFALDLVGEDAALIRPPGRIVTGTSDHPGLVQQPERPSVEREIAGQHRGSGPVRECSVEVARRSPKPSVKVRIRALPPSSIRISRCHRQSNDVAR